jgi:hypothetical protein
MRAPGVLPLLLIVACGGDDSGPTYATDHPRIYMTATRDRLAADLASGRPAAMRIKAATDRWVSGKDVYGFQPWHAALLGQLTADATYCAAAVAAVDKTVRDDEAMIATGATPKVANDSYLDVGEVIGNVALVYDWCFDAIDGSRRAAWLAYADQAVWNVWNHDQAKWGDKATPWSGWSVDDPSNNYYYSFLRATMLLGLAAHDEIPTAGGWLIEFHDTKVMGELMPTFNADLVGGGSREGTGYGVSMRRLFELYDVWHASTGEKLADLTPHTRASMLAFMHQIVPTLDRVAPTGDHARDSTAALFDYHRNYLQELISLFPDDPVAPRAQTLLAMSSVPKMDNEFMMAFDLIYENKGVTPQPLEGLGTSYYAPGIGELYARSGWDTHATWVNLIAGPYAQSHAHQDQGSIMIYKDGWLAYDANVDSHSGLHAELDAHSLVRIVDGTSVEQKNGSISKLVALHRGPQWLHAAADLSPAYEGKAAVQKVQRELVYLEPDCVVVYDRVATTAGTEQVWQLSVPTTPTINGSRATVTNAGHTLTIERVGPAQATATVHSFASDGDFSSGFRLDETIAGGDRRFLHVLWIDGAVVTVTAQGESGVAITFGNGTTATVQFTKDAVGGSLTLGGTSTTLAAGLDTLPE